jgi:hypothetical protein
MQGTIKLNSESENNDATKPKFIICNTPQVTDTVFNYLNGIIQKFCYSNRIENMILIESLQNSLRAILEASGIRGSSVKCKDVQAGDVAIAFQQNVNNPIWRIVDFESPYVYFDHSILQTDSMAVKNSLKDIPHGYYEFIEITKIIPLIAGIQFNPFSLPLGVRYKLVAGQMASIEVGAK